MSRAAETFDHCVHETFYLSGIGLIRFEGHCAHSFGFDLADNDLGLFGGRHIAEDYVCSRVSKRECDCGPDTA